MPLSLHSSHLLHVGGRRPLLQLLDREHRLNVGHQLLVDYERGPVAGGALGGDLALVPEK